MEMDHWDYSRPPILLELHWNNPWHDVSWTHRWATMLTWLDSYNGPNRQALVCLFQLELQDVPKHTLQAVLNNFFAQVELAKQKFDALFLDHQRDIECHAKQAMREVQLGIDRPYYTQDTPVLPSYTSPIHDICEWLFARMAGAQKSKELSVFRIHQVEIALCRILDLSSQRRLATSYQKHSRKAVDIALSVVRELQDYQTDRHYLQNFTRQQGALLLALLRLEDPANLDDSFMVHRLKYGLQQAVNDLAGFVERRADGCQKLYQYLLSNRELISQCLDLAARGQGRRIVDDLLNNLSGLVSSLRAEVNYWKSLSRDPSPWPDIKPIYHSALGKLPNPAASEQLAHEHSPAAIDAIYNVKLPQAQHVAEAVREVSDSYNKVLTLQDGHIRKCLIKTQPSMNTLVDKTKDYFEDVVSQATAQPSVNVATSVAKNALSVAESWNGLYNKVNLIVYIFGGLFFCKMSVTASAFSMELDLKPCANDDGIISKMLHPFLSDLERCVLDTKKQYSSFSDCLLKYELNIT